MAMTPTPATATGTLLLILPLLILLLLLLLLLLLMLPQPGHLSSRLQFLITFKGQLSISASYRSEQTVRGRRRRRRHRCALTLTGGLRWRAGHHRRNGQTSRPR